MHEITNGMPDIKANNAQRKQTDIWKENQSHINELYAFLLGHQLKNDAQDWLCCKILHTAYIGIKIYSETGREPQLDKEMCKV